MEPDHQGPVLQVARAAALTTDAAAKAGAALEELQRASMTATMIARVATAVAQSAQISELAEAVLDQTIDALGAYACGIFTADSTQRTLHLLSSRHVPPDVSGVTTLSFDTNSGISRAARTRKLQIIEDLSEVDEPPAIAEFFRTIGALRIMCAPLLAAGELVGVLAYVITNPGICCGDERGALEVVASIVGVGLSNALAKERATRERVRLQTILEYAPHGIVYADLVEGRATHNPAAERLLGVELSDRAPTGEPPAPIYYPDGRPVPPGEAPGTRVFRGETVTRMELLIQRPTGERRPVLLSATPVTFGDGRVEGAVFAFEDISTLKELERLREEFAAIVAHDLRNPITAIRATADVILMKARDGDQLQVERSGIERIRQSSVRLDDMVKDLMDASRIEAGRLGLEAAPLEAEDVVTSLVSQILPTLGSHAVELDLDVGHVRINADRLRLEQILTNLVENAAKYSPEQAPIAVRVRKRDGGVAISVADHGTGIAPEEMPLLFDRFYQAQRARAMRKGLGLGLYITKGLVEAHGGHITVASELGNGSTFEVWLPAVV